MIALALVLMLAAQVDTSPPPFVFHRVTSGTSVYDEAVYAPIQVVIVEGATQLDRHEYWSAYRGRMDWATYIGTEMFAPGDPRVLTLYMAHSEKSDTVVVVRTHPREPWMPVPTDTSGVATIRVMDYVPAPFESRSYPTLTPETRPSEPARPGYQRVYRSWSSVTVDSVSYSKYRKPTTITHVLCRISGGQSVSDEPISGQPVVQMLVFLGGKRCDTNRHEIWAVHRDALDWQTFVGARMYEPGEPRVLALWPAHGETVVVRRTR